MLKIILILLPSIICFAVAIKQHTKKGIVINNRYLVASKEEKQNRDWTDYYNQSRNVFILIALIFLSSLTPVIGHQKLFYPIFFILCIITCIYAVVSSHNLLKKHGL